MAYMRWYHQSQVLRLQTSLTITLPNNTDNSMHFPVMYLLHGGTENSTTWIRETSIERISEEYGLISVSIDGLSSAYVNMRHGGKYYTYLTEELPAFLQQKLAINVSPDNTIIAGFSMGGQGALRAALKNPERYAACFALSGARDTVPLFKQWAQMEGGPDLSGVEDALGPVEEMYGSPDDLVTVAKQAANCKRLPVLYIACAQNDYAAFLTNDFHDFLNYLKIPHIYYNAPGIHDYRFGEEALRYCLTDYFNEKKKCI